MAILTYSSFKYEEEPSSDIVEASGGKIAVSTFSIIYRGPDPGKDPNKAERITSALVARYPFSRFEIKKRISQLPFTLISGLTKNQADRHALFLKTMGAEIEIKQEPERPLESFEGTEMEASLPGGRYIFKGALKSIIYALSSGLLILLVIFLAGLIQILAAHFWPGRAEPIWILSASGWATIGLAIFIFLGLVTLRLPTIVNILKLPDLSTPLNAVRSFYLAINTRHWKKALLCLCHHPESKTLGALPEKQAIEYLRTLASQFVLPMSIKPESSSLLNLRGNSAILRYEVTIVARKPLSDGTRLEKTIIDIGRFIKISKKWFLLDGFIFGQRDPKRLPLPACRECGAETAIGQSSCDSCDAQLPPYAQESDKWLPPMRKPDLAALLSAVIPGLGQTYNGQPLKGAVIAATFWMILPWAAGVVDAMVVSERINRRGSHHDLYSRPLFPVILHLGAFLVAIMMLFFNAENLPVIRDVFVKAPEVTENLQNNSVVARFRGMDSSYSILFPFHWNVEEVTPSENRVETGKKDDLSVHASSPDGLSTIVITTLPLPKNWESCPQAREARRKMEEKNEQIANIECGSRGGREQYRIDSYTANRLWRRTLLVLSFSNELVVISFVCPLEQQSKMVKVFEDVANSIRFVQQSNTSIRR